jgi:hypothetical protein
MRSWLATLLLLALLPGLVCAGGRRPDRRGREWSDTWPPINLTHLFHGEINARGKPVGYHARPGGVDPAGCGVDRRLDPPDGRGVYTAMVWIGRRNRTKMSTFYPDRLSRAQVIEAVLHAFQAGQRRGETFRGPSGLGFAIEGYFQDGRINTAYPVYGR